MDVSIQGVHFVSCWTWDNQGDTCGICRQLFDACCPMCKIPGDDCAIISGKCTHSFHIHCIEKWLERERESPHCPMCRREWEYKTS